jgi:hypothetical protein
MLPKELFSLLTVDNIEFNGDVDLTDIGVLWSMKFEAPELLEDEEPLVSQDELVEALMEDLEIIHNLLDEYDEDWNEFEVGEIQIDDDFAFVDLIVVDLDFAGE